MGDSEGDANETPRAATVKPFRLMRHEVIRDKSQGLMSLVDEVRRKIDKRISI